TVRSRVWLLSSAVTWTSVFENQPFPEPRKEASACPPSGSVDVFDPLDGIARINPPCAGIVSPVGNATVRPCQVTAAWPVSGFAVHTRSAHGTLNAPPIARLA